MALYSFWSLVYVVLAQSYYFSDRNIKEIAIYLTKAFLFYGTYAHLWYLISSCVAIYVVYFLINQWGFKITLVTSGVMYLAGLLGDSYYGILIEGRIKKVVDMYISTFGEMYNSFIWIVIFMVFGIGIKRYDVWPKINFNIIISMYLLFLSEHFVLWKYNICIDNNTSVFLLLFAPIIFMYVIENEEKITNYIDKSTGRLLKDMSFTIYLVHPLVKLYVVKFTGLDKSYMLFGVVLILSLLISLVVTKLKRKYNNKLAR